MLKMAIPKEDLSVINAALRGGSGQVQTIIKGPSGELMKAKTRTPISSGYAVADFRGRVFKHQVSVVREGFHIIIAESGQLFEDIPLEKRKMVFFHEADFK